MTEPGGREDSPPITTGTPLQETSAGARACPYLLATAGWRSAAPAREHHCTAIEPTAQLTTDKQRRLCLTSEHTGCATYVAAGEARVARTPGAGHAAGRPIARTSPVVVERARPLLPIDRLGDTRRWGQVGLVALMLVAVFAVAVARFGGSSESVTGGVGGVAPSLSASAPPATAPSVDASPGGTVKPSAAQSQAPVSTQRPVATPGATARPGPAGSPAAMRTYTVKTGDTLSAIAARFGTTVTALQKLNGIADPSIIRVGQVLKIP